MNLRILILLTAFLAVCGCEEPADVQAPKSALPAKKDEFYKVERQKVANHLKVAGTVIPDKEGAVRIVTYLPGAVESIFVRVGDAVRKGDRLISIKSAEINAMHSRYVALQSQSREANRIYSLNQQLHEAGALARNDLLKSEAAARELNIALAGLKRKLEIYGVSPDVELFSDQFEIKSPIDGRVAEIPAVIGMLPEASDTLMTIADPAKILVVANMPDSDVAKIQKGAPVSFTTDIFPKTVFKGAVAYISDVSNPAVKSIKVYIRLPGDSHLFKLNMFLDMKILRDELTLPMIPKAAVVYKQGKFFVYVKDGEAVKQREVFPKKDVDERFMLVDGVDAGDEVLLSAINKEKV